MRNRQHDSSTPHQTVVLNEGLAGGDLGAKVNMALHSRPRRNLLIKVPAGSYDLRSTIWLGDSEGVTLDLKGVVIRVAPDVTALSLGGKGSRQVTVKGGIIHGGSSCFQAYAGDDQVNEHLTISLDECSGTSKEGIFLYDNGAHWNNFRNVLIDGGLYRNTGGPNIMVSGVEGFHLLNTRLETPSLVGPNHGAQPVNLSVGAAEHVLIEHNDVSGTPLWHNLPLEYNSPGSGIYVVEAQDVHVVSNVVHDSRCTAETCRVSGPYGTLPDKEFGYEPYGADGIHLDTVIGGEIRENRVSGYVRGIVDEVGMNVVVAQNHVERSWANGIQDSSRFEEVIVNSLESTRGLKNGPSVLLAADSADKKFGAASIAVSVRAGLRGTLVEQTLDDRRKLPPTPQMWIKSSTPESADTLELWLSVTDKLVDADNKLPLPALTAGAWQSVTLTPQAMMMLDSSHTGGVKTWGIVAVKPLRGGTLHLQRLSSIMNAFNNVYSDNVIQSTGMQAFSSTGCGDHTIIRHNTIQDPGSMGASMSVWYGAAVSIEPRGTSCLKRDVVIEENTVSSRKGTLLNAEKYTPIALSGKNADGGVLEGVEIRSNSVDSSAGMNRPAALYGTQGGVVRDVHVK